MINSNNQGATLKALTIFAHPDDEGFSCGGTLAELVHLGHRVTAVCGTNGDVGEISDPALATPETLGTVRQAEMRAAMAVTGVKDVRFLGYRDSGMIGTSDNENPRSLRQAPSEEVVGKIAGLLEELEPDLVITHDPTGGYGHPDHVAMNQHTTAAVSEYWAKNPRKPLLYYACFPRSNFRRMWREMLDAGIKPPFGGDDVEVMGTPDDVPTNPRDVSAFVPIKRESLERHRTQISPEGPMSRLRAEFVLEFMSTEYFSLLKPPGAGPAEDILAALSSTGSSKK